MEKKEDNNRELLQRYLENRCTPSEWKAVVRLLATDSSARELMAAMQTSFTSNKNIQHELSQEKSLSIRERLLQQVAPAPVVSLKYRWQRFAVAASVIAVLITGAYYLNSNRSSNLLSGNKVPEKKVPAKIMDVEPGGNKAILTLSNGSALSLDDTKNGSLPAQGNTLVMKGNGTLNYQSSGKQSAEVLYNTLSTPRGGQYQVTLPDGTRVWLNAASSLRYPTNFDGDNRKVEMTGEVYFEVASNKEKPFIVSVNGAEVEVLGTHFNIMAYKDESLLKTTLMEGSVRFSYHDSETMLKPGQQSLLSDNGDLKRVSGVDVNKVVAWKNGNFDFDGADAGTVLRQLARWYDVDATDQNLSDEVFFATIPRSMKLSEVLKALEMTGKIRFEIADGKIIVQ